jgi:hypothetical protein
MSCVVVTAIYYDLHSETQHFTIFFSLQSGAMCVCQLGLALQHKTGCEIDLCKL